MTQKNRKYAFHISVGLFLFSVLALSISYDQIFSEGGTGVLTSDAYYHLRRVHLFVHNFPTFPVRDSFLDFPDNGVCFWAPLFDAITALAVILGAGFSPAAKETTYWASIVPPLLGAGTVTLLFRSLLLRLPVIPSLVAALVLLFNPRFLFNANLGHTDHHVLELFTYTLALYMFLSLGNEKQGSRVRLRIVLLGFFFSLEVLAWTGALIYHGLWCLAALPAFGRHRETRLLRFRLGISSFVGALFLVGPSLWFVGKSGAWFSFETLSLFQPLFLFAVGVPLVFAGARTEGTGFCPAGISIRKFSIFSVVVFCLALVLFWGSFTSVIVQGIQFLVKQDPWIQSIDESRSLFRDSLGKTISNFCFIGTYAFFIIPFVGAYWAFNRRRDPVERAFLCWAGLSTLFYFVLAVNQMRYSHIMGIWVAAVFGILFSRLAVRLKKYGRRSLIIALALTVIPVWPFLSNFSRACKHGFPAPVEPAELDMMNWIRENTEYPGDPFKLNGAPDYGILANWDLGHPLLWIAQRPAAIGNFGINVSTDEKFYGLSAILLHDDEDDLLQLMDRYRLKYVLSSFNVGFYQSIIRFNSEDPESYLSCNSAFVGNQFVFKRKFFESLWVRLAALNGNAFPVENGRYVFTPAHHLRLVKLTGDPSAIRISEHGVVYIGGFGMKLFERVAGAALVAYAKQGSRMTARTTFYAHGAKLRCVWEADASADSSGVIRLIVPYGKSSRDGVRASGKYIVSVDEAKPVEVEVSNEAVLAGEEILIPASES